MLFASVVHDDKAVKTFAIENGVMGSDSVCSGNFRVLDHLLQKFNHSDDKIGG
jgi:hypothetical protein